MTRPSFIRKPVRKNYWLPSGLTSQASIAARERYGISMSELIRRLLTKEVRHPKGTCFVHPRD